MDMIPILGVPLMIAAVSFLVYRFSQTRKLDHKRGRQWAVGRGGTMERVELGGGQYDIAIHTVSPDLPVLLVVYGGTEKGGWIERLDTEKLSRKFTVVFWNPFAPVTGIRFSKEAGADSLELERILSDAAELIEWLVIRFGQEKMLLWGWSRGSLIGLWLAHRFPEKFHGYFGVSQVLRWDQEVMATSDREERLGDRSGEDAIRKIRSVDIPVHFVQSRKDPMVPAEWFQEFYDNLTSPSGKGLSWLHPDSELDSGNPCAVEQQLLAFAQSIGISGSSEGWMFTIKPDRR